MGSHSGLVTDFVFSDRNDESEMTMLYKGNRVHIAISARNLEKSHVVRNRYLHFLRVAEAYELDGLTVDDLYIWILEGCAEELSQLPTSTCCAIPTLEDYIHIPTFHYALHATEDGKFALLHSTVDLTENLLFGVDVDVELCSPWPSFAPSQVEICADSPEDALSRTPRKVLVDGNTTCFFKPYRYCDALLARHELQKYSSIRRANLDDLQISRLLGLVRDTSGTTLGLLLFYIESRSVVLGCAVRPETPKCLRRRWAKQITNTLSRLHKAGIAWGDAKPDNILVDTRNNAWIIDFGGGYTENWVDRDLAGTLQGDQQGLSRIIEFIYR